MPSSDESGAVAYEYREQIGNDLREIKVAAPDLAKCLDSFYAREEYFARGSKTESEITLGPADYLPTLERVAAQVRLCIKPEFAKEWLTEQTETSRNYLEEARKAWEEMGSPPTGRSSDYYQSSLRMTGLLAKATEENKRMLPSENDSLDPNIAEVFFGGPSIIPESPSQEFYDAVISRYTEAMRAISERHPATAYFLDDCWYRPRLEAINPNDRFGQPAPPAEFGDRALIATVMVRTLSETAGDPDRLRQSVVALREGVREKFTAAARRFQDAGGSGEPKFYYFGKTTEELDKADPALIDAAINLQIARNDLRASMNAARELGIAA